MVTLLLPRCEPGLFWHVRHALGVQILDKVFHGATESVMRMFDAVLCKRQQHAIDVGRASHIHGICGQCIHSGEITCHPMSVGEIEPIAPSLEKGLTRFSTKAERHIIALGITPSTSPGDAAQEDHEPPE